MTRQALILMSMILWLAVILLIGAFTLAHAGADFGTEGGGNFSCYTTALPANVWSLVSYDNAGQPCWTKPDGDATCDPAATWNWQLHGSLQIAPVSRSGKVEIQLWVGNGGGSCYPDNPIVCDNPATHYLQEAGSYRFNLGYDTAVPFEFMIYHSQPYFAYYGDANYFGMWVFAKPSIPATCKSTNYGDMVYKDESN